MGGLVYFLASVGFRGIPARPLRGVGRGNPKSENCIFLEYPDRRWRYSIFSLRELQRDSVLFRGVPLCPCRGAGYGSPKFKRCISRKYSDSMWICNFLAPVRLRGISGCPCRGTGGGNPMCKLCISREYSESRADYGIFSFSELPSASGVSTLGRRPRRRKVQTMYFRAIVGFYARLCHFLTP